MKKSVIALLTTVLIASIVSAEDSTAGMSQAQGQKKEARKNMSFDEMKAKMSANLEKRLATVQKAQECVNNATTKEQLKECRPKKNMKKEKKAKKERMKEEK